VIERRLEELLEHLYVWEVEEGRAGSPDFPAGAFEAAAAAGLIRREGGAWRLTAAGLPEARDVVRRHRLAERLLKDVLSVGADDQLEDGACTFEHILQHGLAERVCTLLGHPAVCPHGKPIPRGPCCRAARRDPIREVSALADGEVGWTGRVAYLSTRDSRQVQKLMAMGVLPGSPMRLLQRFPTYVFQVGYSQFAVDRELASLIFVHWHPPEAAEAPGPPGGPHRHRHGPGAG
jgi:DtxR family Mn-dependent transcriptional regulator